MLLHELEFFEDIRWFVIHGAEVSLLFFEASNRLRAAARISLDSLRRVAFLRLDRAR